MQILKAVLIDDESSSLENLRQKLLEFCPGVKVLATAQRPEEGILLIHQHKPDVVFLDIEMPRMNGFVMLEKFAEIDFEIIFITAYNHYAIDAIRISAFDYLVKPVSISELQAAVERLLSQSRKKSNEKFELLRKSIADPRTQENKIAIPVNDGIEFLQIKNIVRIESSSNYSKIILVDGKKLLVTRLLKDFEEILSLYNFYRIHNSHLINLSFISKYVRGDGGQVIMQNGDIIDVSRRKKDEFLKLIG